MTKPAPGPWHLNLTIQNYIEGSLDDLERRHPSIVMFSRNITTKLNNNHDLTIPERQLIALALHGTAMNFGPASFEMVMEAAHAVQAEAYIAEYAKSWIGYAKEKKP